MRFQLLFYRQLFLNLFRQVSNKSLELFIANLRELDKKLRVRREKGIYQRPLGIAEKRFLLLDFLKPCFINVVDLLHGHLIRADIHLAVSLNYKGVWRNRRISVRNVKQTTNLFAGSLVQLSAVSTVFYKVVVLKGVRQILYLLKRKRGGCDPLDLEAAS